MCARCLPIVGWEVTCAAGTGMGRDGVKGVGFWVLHWVVIGGLVRGFMGTREGER